MDTPTIASVTDRHLLAVAWAVPTFAAVLALTGWTAARAGYVVLVTVRPVVQRISEYQKGPVEAIVLLTTVGLGVAALMLQK